MLRYVFTAIATLVLACPAQADLSFDDVGDDTVAYVESNLLGIFYHELGHALIDLQDLPIFGQEEDAADVLSIFLIDAFFEEESAVQIAYDTAFGFLGEADASGTPVFWDVHGPDLQRYYNLVCVFYGANPDERDDVAEDLGLPEERADYCSDEYDQAAHSWGQVLDTISTNSAGQATMVWGDVDVSSDSGALIRRVIGEELEALNADFRLAEALTISIIPCGEANAFYDPDHIEIVMCTEFVDLLVEMAPEF